MEDTGEDEVRFGEFDVSDICEVQKVLHKMDKSQINDEGIYPCFSSDTKNNGIKDINRYQKQYSSTLGMLLF